MTKQIISTFKILALAVGLSFGLSYVYAWTAPTATPPSGNVSAPINTGATAQTKSGEITFATTTITKELIVGGLGINTTNLIADNIIIPGGTVGQVLASGAGGVATWTTPVATAITAGSVTYSNGNGGWVVIPVGATTVTFKATGGRGGNTGSANGGLGGSTSSGSGGGVGAGGTYSWPNFMGGNGSPGSGGAGGYGGEASSVGPSGGSFSSGAYSNGRPGGSNGKLSGGGGAFAYSIPVGWIVAVGGGGGGGGPGAIGGGGGGYGGGGNGGCNGSCALTVQRGGGGGGGSYAHALLTASSPSGRSIPVSVTGQAIYLHAGAGAGLGEGGSITMSWQ